MEYIDKTKLRNEGEAIIDAFLKRLQEAGEYPDDLYEAFKSDKDENGEYSKDKLIKVLLTEQDNHCCYCMKKLDRNEDEITLEHLILNSITERQKYNEYFKRNTVLNNKVVWLKILSIKMKQTRHLIRILLLMRIWQPHVMENSFREQKNTFSVVI